MREIVKHTPGPWVEDAFGTLIGADGTKVCVKGLGLAHVIPGGDYPVERANAQLIKTAPDLFDAAELAEAAMSNIIQFGDTKHPNATVRKMVREAREAKEHLLAALAKAEARP